MSILVVTLPWKAGAVAEGQSPSVVSATHTEILRWRAVPGIVRRGLRLRSAWAENPGSIGMQLALDLRRRVSWSISMWESEADLDRFVRSSHHRRAVEPFRSQVRVQACRWHTTQVDPRPSWVEARARLSPTTPS